MAILLPSGRRWLRAPALIALALAAGLPNTAAARDVRLHQGVPAVAGASGAGTVASATPIATTIVLRPRDSAALAAYAAAVSDPASAEFRHYLSVNEFAARFAPPPADVAAVRQALVADGLSVGSVSPNGLALSARSSAGRTGRAFGLSFRRLRLASGRTAYANTRAPELPASVAPLVQSVIGLDDVRQLRPVDPTAPTTPSGAERPGIRSAHVATGGPQACTAASGRAGASGAYTADELAATYGFASLYGAGDLGLGATVALYELAPYNPSNLVAYESCYGTSASVGQINVDGGAPADPAGAVEADLDVQDVVGLAPQASVLVYQGPPTGQGPYDVLARIVSDDRAKVISTAWGICEAELGRNDAQAEQTLLEEAAVQGQSVVAASGDNGAQDCTDAQGNPIDGLAVDDPASQPYVTGVGGTRLGPYPSGAESVWNDNRGTGGGGLSAFWVLPSWQQNVRGPDASGAPCGQVTGDCRQVPDVSADASPLSGYETYLTDPSTGQSGWASVGGTSAASPLWGALLALVDASSACRGIPIGFANPLLYAMPAADFRDITTGDNALPGTTSGGYSARAGYDMASGLGTPLAGGLAAGLCSASVALHTPTTTTTTTAARPGTVTLASPGDLVTRVGRPVTVHVAARDSLGAALQFSASGLPAGLSLDRTTGLITGRPTRANRARVTLRATNAAGAGATTSVTWTVEGLPSVPTRAVHRSRGGLTLQVAFAAGAYAPPLARVWLGVSGVSFQNSSGRLDRAITVTVAHRRWPFRASRVHGGLLIVLGRRAPSLAVQIGPGAITRAAPIHSLRLSGSLGDVAGGVTSLS